MRRERDRGDIIETIVIVVSTLVMLVLALHWRAKARDIEEPTYHYEAKP